VLAHLRALTAADADAQVRAILIHGTRDCFTAGNDLKDFLERPPHGEESPTWRFLRAVSSAAKPLVAAVGGAAVGIGTTMLLTMPCFRYVAGMSNRVSCVQSATTVGESCANAWPCSVSRRFGSSVPSPSSTIGPPMAATHNSSPLGSRRYSVAALTSSVRATAAGTSRNNGCGSRASTARRPKSATHSL